MSAIFYKSITFLPPRWGRRFFQVFAWFVATGYFVFFPRRVGDSIRIYQALYPNRHRLFHLWCTWRQFHSFTGVFLDRYLLQDSDIISYNSEGIEHLEGLIDRGKGGILLMSHMGNWEVAAQLLRRKLKNLRLLLYMGARQKEQIEQLQKETIAQSGIRIIAVDEGGGSPLDIVEGIKFIESGGVVSLAGDLVWRKDQRAVPVKFLEQEILLPEAPHLFALLSGAPLITFFAFRIGRNKYRFTMSQPVYLKAASRDDRPDTIRRSAQQYADLLEAALRNHPFQWYHFRPFLKPDAAKHRDDK